MFMKTDAPQIMRREISMTNNRATYLISLSLLSVLLFMASTVLAEEQQDLTVYCGAGLTGALREIG
jgi:hypothetical protein